MANIDADKYFLCIGLFFMYWVFLLLLVLMCNDMIEMDLT